ncbi:MAG: 23S rRNA (pseudouridine(1915)-N(3))-methyltransferase RlmH [Bdellovibrionales bacterium]
MQCTVLSIGKWKEKSLKEVFDSYASRCQPKISLTELELPAREQHGDAKFKEAALLQKHIPAGSTVIACDERGKEFTSRGFAENLEKWMAANGPKITFLIGGADGLDAGLVKQAHATLSLGQMVWPHLLARVMLAEQIYRAQTILSNHPYHRD